MEHSLERLVVEERRQPGLGGLGGQGWEARIRVGLCVTV